MLILTMEDFYTAYKELIERVYNIDTSKKPPLVRALY